MEHSAGFLCPAVLLHIFPLEFGISCFKIRKIVTPDPFRIYSVIRGFVLKHTVSAYLLQRIFQIKYQLADIRRVLGVIRTAGKEYRAYLPCGLPAPLRSISIARISLVFVLLNGRLFVLLKRYFQRYFRLAADTVYHALGKRLPHTVGQRATAYFLLPDNFVKAYATISASSLALILFFLFIRYCVYTVPPTPSTAPTATDTTQTTAAVSTTLKHLEKYYVSGLSKSATYQFIETNDTDDIYKVKINGENETNVASESTKESASTSAETVPKMKFTNTLNSISPTGVIMRYGPYVGMVLLAGLFIFMRRRASTGDEA
jgi:hypothetical protein